ncbi:MAG: radical SAM protein, partial [bacterium]
MKVNYLRLSITDSCNLNCVYCRPNRSIRHLDRSQLLCFEEMRDLVSLMGHWGIEKVRITGGEPLMRNSVVTLVEMLSQIKGIKDLSMTTNGVRLAEFA